VFLQLDHEQFFLYTPIQTGLGAHPAYVAVCTSSLSWGKAAGHGIDHPFNQVLKLKKDQSCTCSFHLGLHGMAKGELYLLYVCLRLLYTKGKEVLYSASKDHVCFSVVTV
jgi:hypothetical protein